MEHSSPLDFSVKTCRPKTLTSKSFTTLIPVSKTEKLIAHATSQFLTGKLKRSPAITRNPLETMPSEKLLFLADKYTADCLIMSDNFDFADEVVAEAIAFFEDDSRPSTHDETEAAIAALS